MAFRAFTFYLGMHFPPFIVWSFDLFFMFYLAHRIPQWWLAS